LSEYSGKSFKNGKDAHEKGERKRLRSVWGPKIEKRKRKPNKTKEEQAGNDFNRYTEKENE